jgi:hypothetical protein
MHGIAVFKKVLTVLHSVEVPVVCQPSHTAQRHRLRQCQRSAVTVYYLCVQYASSTINENANSERVRHTHMPK